MTEDVEVAGRVFGTRPVSTAVGTDVVGASPSLIGVALILSVGVVVGGLATALPPPVSVSQGSVTP